LVKFGDINYRLCLLDTNAVSAMVKNDDGEFANYLDWALLRSAPVFVPSFSLFTVLELRRSPAVYELFLDAFSTMPCAFVKSFDQLVAEEAKLYPNGAELNPVLFTSGGPVAPEGGKLRDVLETHFQSAEGIEQEREWNGGQSSIVAGIGELVANFPPEGDSYTANELRMFVQLTGFGQIAMREWDFANRIIKEEKGVDIDAFPSVKAATYTVFYKFYADRTRRPTTSDAFDIIISSVTPYVDAIITEAHQAAVLSKTMKRDPFIKDLLVFTLRDLRASLP
jgi:hypothetical protein